MRKYLLCAIAALSIKAYSQNRSYDFYSFLNGNMFNVNPAYSAKEKGINTFLNAQSQNAGVSYANKNIMAGGYSRIAERQGLGAKLISDSRGAFQVLQADVSYAYVAKFAEAHTLSLGLAGGIYNSNLVTSRIENYGMLDASDPTLTDNQFNSTQFTAGAGALYNYKDLEISLSAPHMITTTQPFISYINFAAFYTKKFSDKFKLQPWISYQSIPVTKNVFAFLARGTYNDLLWAQAGYQTNGSFLASFGAMIENIGIAYGFKFPNSDFKQISSGTHEVLLSIRIGTKASKKGAAQASDLESVIANLDRLLAQTITPETRAMIRAELEKLKVQLKNLEIDNSDPEKAKKVEAQLKVIDEKIQIIEKRLTDE